MNQKRAARPSAPESVKRWNLKRIIIALILIVGALAGLYAAIDYPYRQRFSTVYNEVEKIRRDVIEPAGGVEWRGGTYTPYFAGNGLFNTLGCIDIHCPTVSRTWFVSVGSSQQENEFITNIFQTEGYRQVNGGAGTKDGLQMLVSMNSTGTVKSPYPAPQGKAWVFVQVSVYLK